MNMPHSICDDGRILSVLTDERFSISDPIVEHLAHCTRCQQRIEELAATTGQWESASQSLSEQPTIVSQNESQATVDSRSWRGLLLQDRPNAWTMSQAKQLLSPPSHPEMLGRLGRYEIESMIGSGGMGVVFKGFDTELNRPVAIKVLSPHLAGVGSSRKRFAREARAAAAVVHEHVVPIHNVETEADSPFMVMQYVCGESLQKRIDHEGPLDLCQILRIAVQIASGLGAAHDQGLVHRDIKPANILLEQGIERALITDFGLARAADDASLTQSGHQLGTPQYMSPEQASGQSLDARSDLFSLGSVIYAMCTGRPPFRAENSFGILKKIHESEPRSIREINPSIPDWLEKIVNRLHAKLPADRFASAIEVKELLAECLVHTQQPTITSLPSSLKSKSSAWRSWRFTLEATISPSDSEKHRFGRPIVLVGILVALIVAAIPLIQNYFVVRNEDTQMRSDRIAILSLPNAVATTTTAASQSPSLRWNQGIEVANALEQDFDRFETSLRDTMAKDYESLAHVKTGDVSRYSVEPWTTGFGKPPTIGTRVDIFVNIHVLDPTDPEVRPVVRGAIVTKTNDSAKDTTNNRQVTIEMELTRSEVDRLASYNHLDSFTFAPTSK